MSSSAVYQRARPGKKSIIFKSFRPAIFVRDRLNTAVRLAQDFDCLSPELPKKGGATPHIGVWGYWSTSI